MTQVEACGILASASEGGAKVVARLLDAIPWLKRALEQPGAPQDLICHVSVCVWEGGGVVEGMECEHPTPVGRPWRTLPTKV